MLDDVFSELFSDNQTPYKMLILIPLRFTKLITEILTLCDKNGRNFEINREERKDFPATTFIRSVYKLLTVGQCFVIYCCTGNKWVENITKKAFLKVFYEFFIFLSIHILI